VASSRILNYIFTFNILQSRTEEVNGVPVVPLFDTPLNGINMEISGIKITEHVVSVSDLINPLIFASSLMLIAIYIPRYFHF
jgi:putative colanic acid biosynthesis UDP-glucose lipid carrier transferase